ncbi:MAG TPA: SCO family protein [Acetobacteraceae bacterium]|jgi:protein SCO1/2|nr:SCO family protein [Acetobacteraceae bacterium]
MGRRPFLAASLLSAVPLTACGQDPKWHNVDVSGTFPPLAFTMQRTGDGQEVTQADYRGRVDLLYFGYTNCPDVCPTALANMAVVFKDLGPLAKDVTLFFVTVDPDRDSLAVLSRYVALFAPEIVGLRGTPDQLATLARRYRVAYSVTPARGDQPYRVSHSGAIYVFDKQGACRLIIPSMSSRSPDISGTVADLETLVKEPPPGLLSRILHAI